MPRDRRPLFVLAALIALTLASPATATVSAPSPATAVPSYTNYPITTLSGEDPKAATQLGHDAGEPSIGVNHRTGKVMYLAGLQTIQATFDDRTVPARGPARQGRQAGEQPAQLRP